MKRSEQWADHPLTSRVRGAALKPGADSLGTNRSTETLDNSPRVGNGRGCPSRRYLPTGSIDSLITAMLTEREPVSGVFQRIADRLGWTSKAVVRRAEQLHLYQPKRLQLWTPNHVALLHQSCLEGLLDHQIRDRFKERFQQDWSLSAIKAKRYKLGLVSHNADLSCLLSRRQKRYWPTDQIDESIRACFSRKYEHVGALRSAAKSTGWSTAAIVRRARELGLSHARNEAEWSTGEEELLETFAFQSPVSIQTKLNRQFGTHRTLTAIEAKRQRMNLLNNLDGMNLRQLAEALGVAKITVHRWLDCGRIRGLVRFPHLQEVGRHMWFFPTPEIRRFILENLECVDLGRVEKHWFVSVVRGSYRRRR
ncbi:MAG: MarR family winged helix-turn-helix transcriptional regulator [Bryobacteraceae bacterium]